MEKEHLARSVYRTIIYIYVTLIIYSVVSSLIPFLRPYRAILTAAIFLYVPLYWVEKKRVPPHVIGLTFKGWKSAFLDFLKIALWVFPFFTGAFFFYMYAFMGFRFHFTMPTRVTNAVIFHLFGVAFPEEFFFRGFLQAMLNRVYGRRWHFFGCAFGPSLFITSALFALGHLIFDPRPERLAVFFPALLFGILRERTEGVIASTAMHFFSNLLVFFFEAWLMKPIS